ncbi:MAG: GNAT family N-acetyltransferase [Rhodobacterales bacterium]|nr:GNAT family N-acetyltransferase [Rhodobacterales bacterium]
MNSIDDERAADGATEPTITIRPAGQGDIPFVIALDERNTGLAKPDYWTDLFTRYGGRRGRYFLVAEADGVVSAFIIGEIRAWEFGSPPCGWIFALGVHPDQRLIGLASRLFDVTCEAFRQAGITKVRTMLAVDDNLNMSFFRSQGMRGGPFIQLEKRLD